MAPVHVSWSSIELLYNVVRTLGILKENTGAGLPHVGYRAKVKLHGTCCAIQSTDAGVFAQSRTNLLSVEDDYKGFARWVKANEVYFCRLPKDIILFGEWAGPGIERGMASCAIPYKIFAVFAIQVGRGETARLVYEPSQICAMIGTAVEGCKELHVLPWTGDTVWIDYADAASLERAAEVLNDRVLEVEAMDPWIHSAFGISGVGEGLVLYPVSRMDAELPTEPSAYAVLMFKAKGGKHRTVGVKQAVQVAPEVVASADAFATLVLTEARLEQGVTATGGVREPRSTAKFLAWILADVEKETAAELEASGLTWSQVGKVVQAAARTWYLRKN